MNESEFERQLREQPVRPIPAHWREEILRAAQVQSGGHVEADGAGLQPRKRIEVASAWWRELFWPHPVAWAGLAAVWVVIIGLSRVGMPPGHSSALAKLPVSRSAPASPAMKMALAEQWKLREELLNGKTGWEEAPAPAEPPPAATRPRSQARPHAFYVI